MSKFSLVSQITQLLFHIKSTIVKVILQLLCLLFIYQLVRLIFFIANHNQFADVSFLNYLSIAFYAIRFDLSALLIVNSIYIVLSTLPFRFAVSKPYHLVMKIWFIITNGLALILNLIDVKYFSISHRRITFDFIDLVGDSSSFSLVLSYLFSYWYLFFLLIFLVFILEIIASIKFSDLVIEKLSKSPIIIKLIILIGIGSLVVVGARGGSQMRPVTIANAAEYTNANNIPLLLNSTFTFINTSTNTTIEIPVYFSEKESEKYYSPIHICSKDSVFKSLNVVLIVLESFGKEYFGYFNGEYHLTPFLDSLMNKSVVFANGFANANRSIEGIPAIIASIPNLYDNAFITSSYASNEVTSIANLLKKKGYNSSFYHGGRNGTMTFDAFTKLCGYDEYKGLNEYANKKDFDGNWGIWDEPYLQYFNTELCNKKQPFFSTIFTLSSHDPYAIPAQYKDIFKGGKYEIHKTIRYSDFAMRKFFASALKQKWFKNTLFVFTADHTSTSDNPAYTNSYGCFKIPIFFYHQGMEHKNIGTITQQIDVLPNIMEYLNYNENYFSFGKTTFLNTSKSNVSMHCSNNVYEAFNNNTLIKFDGKKTVEQFNLLQDSLLQHANLIKPNLELEKYAKAYLQSYAKCLKQNKLTYSNYIK